MSFKRPKLIVFDLDDTLYLERDYVRSGFVAVGRHLEERLAIKGFASAAWREFIEGRRGDIFDRVLPSLADLDWAARIPELIKIYRQHQPCIVLETDALDSLQELRNRGCVLGLITDGPASSQHAKIEALQLDKWIGHIVCTADLGEGFGKPHPRAFEKISAAAGIEAEACMYIGDNPSKDFDAPAQLGWKTYRCRRPLGLHAKVENNIEVDAEGENLGSLLGLLRE